MREGLLAGAAVFAAAPALAAPDFAGRYAQPAKFYSETAVISRLPDGDYSVTIDLDFRGCRGRVEARGRVEGNSLIATAQKDGKESCRLEIKQEPPGIHVFEENCARNRDAGCEFSSFLRKRP
ncbi:hypothetical protein [Methylocystis parvus]|uniref:hypothetical protein n=1 Tax=Methylocystis parvus TaxID=134 RepID=UPI003C73C5E9